MARQAGFWDYEEHLARLTKHDYNTVRPHSRLGGRTPAEIAKQAVPGHAPALLVIPSTISQITKGLYL